MKNTIIFSLFLLLLAGCDDFLDVNENPNFPAEVEDYLVLPSAEASLVSIMSADYGLIGSFWSQHWAQNNTSSQYKTFESYTLSSNDTRVNGSYTAMYRDALGDNEIIHVNAEKEENWGLYLITSVIKAYGFQYLVDFYDNVPYDEAFQGNVYNFNAKINTGEEVYTRIYELLNKALSKDFSKFDKSLYTKGDLIYGADLTKWVEFANTLKLRIILRQTKVKPEWANAELAALLANGTFLSSDVAFSNFEDADSKSNPLYEADQRQLNTANNIRANATFTSYLKDNNDTRLNKLFAVVAGNRYGMITGSYDVKNEVWEAPDFISQPLLTPEMPVYLMTVAESELLQAEAYLRLGDLANAKSHYDAGVLESFARMGASSDGMIGAGEVYEFPASGFEAQLKAIIMQKWVDAADGQRGMESFIDWVRTGYPEVAAPEIQSKIGEGYEANLPIEEKPMDPTKPRMGYIPGTLIYSKKGTTGGKFPVRLPYADSEINYNSNATEFQKLSDAEVMQTRVWWNK